MRFPALRSKAVALRMSQGASSRPYCAPVAYAPHAIGGRPWDGLAGLADHAPMAIRASTSAIVVRGPWLYSGASCRVTSSTTAARSRAPSLRQISPQCRRAVTGEMDSALAISAVVDPRDSSRST